MPRNPAPKSKRRANAQQNPPAVADDPKPIELGADGAVATIDPPKPKPPKPSDLIAAEVEREKQLAEAREELTFRRHCLLQEGGELTVDEMRVMQTALPASATENEASRRHAWTAFLRREDTRVEQILALQAQAGTAADRAKAAELAKATAGELADKGPALDAKLRKIQAELEALRQVANDAASAVEQRRTAVDALHDRALLPGFVKAELDELHRSATEAFGKELLHLETRQTQIESLLTLDVSSPQGYEKAKGHVSGCDRFGRDEWTRLAEMFVCERDQDGVHTRFRVGKIRHDRWANYLGGLHIELEETKSRIDEITTREKADAKAELDNLRSFYVPR